MNAIRYGFLVISLALAGCASGFSVTGPLEETYQKGETSPDVFLSTVIVRPGGCAPVGAACTLAGPRGAVVIVPFSAETPGWMYEMFAHEICHVVAAVRELQPDPCHQEDRGKIVIHKNRPVAPSGALGVAAQEGSSTGHFLLMPDPLVTRVP